MSDRLDELLESASLEPPASFTRDVMSRIESLPRHRVAPRAPAWLPWAAVACGIVFGIEGFARFVFSAWIIGSAG